MDEISHNAIMFQAVIMFNTKMNITCQYDRNALVLVGWKDVQFNSSFYLNVCLLFA